MKSFLIIQRRPPYGTGFAKEALDVALMASAFEQPISLMFIDDGVWQLTAEQDTQAIAIKNFSPTFKALELYDIKAIYVETESLQQRGLSPEDLIIPVSCLTSLQLGHIIQQHEIILSF